MEEIRKFPEVAERVETGPVQFGDDWPGMFIRGDSAAGYASTLRYVASEIEGKGFECAATALYSMAKELEACRLRPEVV